MKNKLKKVMLITLLFVCSLGLAGCEGMEIPTDTRGVVANFWDQRGKENLDLAEKLYKAGLISESAYKVLKDNISDNIEKMKKSLEDTDTLKNMLKAVTFWQTIEVNENVAQKADFHTLYLTNFLAYWKSSSGKKEGTQVTWVPDPNSTESGALMQTEIPTVEYDAYEFTDPPSLGSAASQVYDALPILHNKGVITPIVIVEDKAGDINKLLNYPIYVLSPSFSEKALDEVVARIKTACEKQDRATLNRYFVPLTYTDDNNVTQPVTLLDSSIPEYQLVRDTIGHGKIKDLVSDIDSVYEGKHDKKNVVIDGAADSIYTNSSGNPLTGSNRVAYGWDLGNQPISTQGNRLGYDMVIQRGNAQMMAVRLTEFNQAAYEAINSLSSNGSDTFLVMGADAIYWMEYPIGYISGFKESDDKASYEAIISRSQLCINLKTGQLSKVNIDANGEFTDSTTAIDMNDPYLTLGGLAPVDGIDGLASFIVDGTTGTDEDPPEDGSEPWNLTFGFKKGANVIEDDGKDGRVPASVGRIILRDYLEATYAPGVVAGESMTVLGRKLRITSLSGSKESPVAKLYDKDGMPIKRENGQEVEFYINDFADIESLVSTTPKVKYISASKESSGDKTNGAGETGENNTGETTGENNNEQTEEQESSDTLSSSITKIDKLGTEIVSEIKVAAPFPGNYIGSQDKNFEDSKPLFYAMAVKRNLFETAMFSGWINNTDTEKNSLAWWNQWLADHNFSYRINGDSLVDYLKGNYAYDLSQEGIIILDLSTISKIQEEYNKEAKQETAEWLRTLFVVFGYILIAYSSILLIAWNVDVNADLGFNILDKLSFGRWVAVKDYDELPYMNTEETNFIKFSDLMVTCLIIITVGILLILIDVMDLVLMLIQLFGGVAKYITKIVVGR